MEASLLHNIGYPISVFKWIYYITGIYMSVTQKTYEFETKYVPRRVSTDRSILYLEFPLHAYWRDVSTIPDLKLRNVEGLIYPSFTILSFAKKYKVEQLEPTKFRIHQASGYTPCVICGKVIQAEVSNVDIEVKRPIERFYQEVAYELTLTALAKELAKKVKAHVMYTHNHKFDVVGKERVTIMRDVGAEEIVVEAEVTTYKCQNDGEKVYGVLGILDHVVSEHEHVNISKRVVEFVEKVNKTTYKLLSLGKENIPILGAFRNTFSYVLVPETGKPANHYRTLTLEYFTRWLMFKVVERNGRVDMVVTTMIPRAMRGIYHHPLFRYAVLEMAYKLDPKKYNWFMIETKKALLRNNYSVDRLTKIDSLITGTLAYTPIEPKHAFSVSMDELEACRSKLDEKAVDLRVFLSHKIV